jgi:hypothetical protein
LDPEWKKKKQSQKLKNSKELSSSSSSFSLDSIQEKAINSKKIDPFSFNLIGVEKGPSESIKLQSPNI